MDRLSRLKEEAGSSRDSALDNSVALSEGYVTAEGSKYFSLSEEDTSLDISPIKDVPLASAVVSDKSIPNNDQLISNLSPTSNKNDLLDSYKFGKQIEAANILSGGVDIFEDNDNSFDGNELVIDDNVVEIDYKPNSELKVTDNSDLQYQKNEDIPDALDNVTAIASKDTEVVLQIGGKNVQAIEIGNGLYLYRKDGEEELAAVQVITGDDDQPTFKFLKVRENAERNLEVYEEIEIEVPKEMPAKQGKSSEQTTSHLSIKDINKNISNPASCKGVDVSSKTKTMISSAELEENKISQESMSEINLNGKMIKFNETRKSPVIHSTPNKEGIPLTKTMVDMQLHSNRQLDNLKTIEVSIEDSKNKTSNIQTKSNCVSNDNDQKLINSKQEGQTELIPKINENLDNIAISTVDEKEVQALKAKTTKIFNKNLCEKQIDITKSDNINKSLSTNLKSAIENSNNGNSSDIVTDNAIHIKGPDISENILNEEADVVKVDENHSTTIITCKKDKNTNSNFINSTAKEDQSETKSSKPNSKTIDVPGSTNIIKHSESLQCENAVNILGVSEGSGSDEDKTDLVIDLDANKDESIDNCLTKDEDNKNAHSSNFINKIEENCEPIVSNKELSPNNKSLSDLKEIEKPKEYLVKDSDNSNVKFGNEKITSTKKEESIGMLPSPKNTKKSIDKIIEYAAEVKPVTELEYCKTKENVDLPSKIGEVKNESVILNPITCMPSSSETVVNKQSTLKEEEEKNNDFKCHLAEKSVTHDQLPMKTEVSKLSNITQKSSNNNHTAVPFGKWTEANRQEFLNKIKEAKVPVTYSNTKSIKQPNDLNRRDVLQKIDSQRQSNAASAKAQEIPQSNIKPVQVSFAKKSTVDRISKVPIKVEKLNPIDGQVVLKNIKKYDTHKTQIATLETDKTAEKKELPQRKEINNQDLIDKTIEGIINRAVAVKPHEGKHNEMKETVKIIHEESLASRLSENQPDIDAIEMKMNELHGIPFVERPAHQLPKIHNQDVKTCAKADNTVSMPGKDTKIPNLLPFVTQPKPALKATVIDLDSEEEVIEHEPITGDIDIHKKNLAKMANISNTFVASNQQKADTMKEDQCVITENEFDKFARRNSITYENCLTVNFEGNKECNLTKSVVKKPVEVKRLKSLIPQKKTLKIETSSKLVPVNEDSLNKNLPSKVQMAYNALTAKRKIDSPITIIEDKPVKVVFMDSNPSISVSPLNVQGKELVQKPITKSDFVTIGTGDSLSSDVLDATDEKITDETKIKTKHQRKQVLTLVEAPEPELIAPRDLELEVSSKKKRKTEEIKPDRILKNVVPKKSYLLGRNAIDDSQPQNLTKNIHRDVINEVPASSHLHAPSAIDNLVKAAELLETQSTTLQSNAYANLETTPIIPASQTPAKRGRGRPRKNPLPDNITDKTKTPSPQKKPRLLDNLQKKISSTTDEDDSGSDEIVKENWTMGKINENIVCPICNKLFRSENVVYKHVKHCSGPSPNRSECDKRSPRRSRFSRESDSKSMESKSDDMDTSIDQTDKLLVSKKRRSKCNSSEGKEDVIVIEDTPVKSKPERIEPKLHESRQSTKTKAHYKISSLSCEYCGKSFRQLSYLVNHKLLHKKENTTESEIQSKDKSVFSCEVCRKEFRKLHHLVQHRQIHNSNNMSVKTRISLSNQNDKLRKAQDIKLGDDQSAGFRCEPCDKSFRKLHHLVEHRETHDGINRQKSVAINQGIIEKPANVSPPQCDICKKTFRKLHHLIEHKEQHNETSSEKSDDKSVKSSLSAKDIIHECSLCYMVFPNEHSLTKHSIICQKKKKQSVLKQTTAGDVNKAGEINEVYPESENKTSDKQISINDVAIEEVSKIPDEKLLLVEEKLIPSVKSDIVEIKENISSTDVEQKGEDLIPTTRKDIEPVNVPGGRCSNIDSKISVKKHKMGEMSEKQENNNKSALRKKSLNKEKLHCNVLEEQTSNLSLTRIKNTVESSDDDEVRYMMNPDYEAATFEAKSFMKVRAKKRNSLQIERPKSKDPVKRRISLNPSKVGRPKSKDIDVGPNSKRIIADTQTSLSSDSEDNDVKYSFPENVIKEIDADKSFKDKRKSSTDKRKTLTFKNKSLVGVAKRKSVPSKLKEKTNSPAIKVIKRRQAEAEHRCDCGELFSSAALLARHASLAHTPPRVRRRRAPDTAAAATATATATTTTATTRRLVDKSRK